MVQMHLPTAAPIVAITQDNYRTRTLTLDARLDAQPGQFIMAWLPRFDEKPFSLVAADPVTLMITAVGPFTRLVHELAVGDRLWLRGPFGQGFAPPATGGRLALVGGGYGVAPLLWLARQQQPAAARIDVFVGARTAADLLYVEHFAALAQAVVDPRPRHHRRRQPRAAWPRDRRAGAAGGRGRSRWHLCLRAARHVGCAGRPWAPPRASLAS
jgi:NAD(P)H-flavin reductase